MINNTTRSRKLKTTVFFLALLIFASAKAQSAGSSPVVPRFDSSAVWHPPADFRSVFHKACDSLSGSDFQNCFLKVMRGMGATPEAMRFAELTDTTGYLRHFVNTGNVDIAYVCYPFRANENYGVILVNGRPGMIDVDDFQYVDLTVLKKDSTYLKIIDDYSDAAVFPGDRYDYDQPLVEPLPDGGERIIVRYFLNNGCHACKQVGAVDVSFNFDKGGNFVGTRLVNVVPFVR